MSKKNTEEIASENVATSTNITLQQSDSMNTESKHLPLDLACNFFYTTGLNFEKNLINKIICFSCLAS